jgi:hypothetical protein
MFFPPNRLGELVRKPGGKPREAAIADAKRNIEEQKEFLTDGIRDAVLSIGAVVLGVEGETVPPAHADIVLSNADRIVGLAGALGLAALETAAKSLCDLIVCLARTGEVTKSPVVVHIQALHRLSENPKEVSPEDEVVLLVQLARLVAHYNSKAKSAGQEPRSSAG